MVAVRTVKLRNSWYYKKSNNALRIDRYSKEFLMQQIVNDTVRNGCGSYVDEKLLLHY